MENRLYDFYYFDCVVKDDISTLIKFFLEDLEQYNKDNNITMDKDQIQKCIDVFKVDYLSSFRNEEHTSPKDKYEEIVEPETNDQYFGDMLKYYDF